MKLMMASMMLASALFCVQFVVASTNTPSAHETSMPKAPLVEQRRTLSSSKGHRSYKDIGYEAMVDQLKALEAKFPHLVELESAQAKYGLPSPGSCGKRPCEMWLMRITHEASLVGGAGGGSGPPHARSQTVAKQSLLDPRPEVFLSGALHGDERVGPTTSIEAARLLATVADCVERAMMAAAAASSTSSSFATKTTNPVASGSLCRGELSEEDEEMLAAGVPTMMNSGHTTTTATTADEREEELLRVRRRRLLWVHRLVRTRSVFVMPAANSLGFFQNRRQEGSVDPNRDFPFVQSKAKCMQSVRKRVGEEEEERNGECK
jgi:hypothetical protein